VSAFVEQLQQLGWQTASIPQRPTTNAALSRAAGSYSYGPNFADQYRQAGSYIDRVLKGEAPADLPVQAPSKYAVAINLGTAKVLGLTVPPALLARADEVIE